MEIANLSPFKYCREAHPGPFKDTTGISNSLQQLHSLVLQLQYLLMLSSWRTLLFNLLCFFRISVLVRTLCDPFVSKQLKQARIRIYVGIEAFTIKSSNLCIYYYKKDIMTSMYTAKISGSI